MCGLEMWKMDEAATVEDELRLLEVGLLVVRGDGLWGGCECDGKDEGEGGRRRGGRALFEWRVPGVVIWVAPAGGGPSARDCLSVTHCGRRAGALARRQKLGVISRTTTRFPALHKQRRRPPRRRPLSSLHPTFSSPTTATTAGSILFPSSATPRISSFSQKLPTHPHPSK
jgi:hypothetical protein